jgi:endonuclease YncB( thermonuclease family)
LDDGRLDPTDEVMIRDHAGKLAKLFPKETGEVVAAVNGVTTIVAKEEVAALNESPEEKKIRLERKKQEKIKQEALEHLNKMLNDHKNWEVSTDKTDSAEISR